MRWLGPIGRRIAQTAYVRRAIVERADLSAFKQPPTLRILAGVSAIIFSFVICWPAISALGAVAVYLKSPWLLALGGPTLYGFSHLCFIAGMAWSGEKYTRILLRCMVRVAFQKYLPEEPSVPKSG